MELKHFLYLLLGIYFMKGNLPMNPHVPYVGYGWLVRLSFLLQKKVQILH